MEIDISSIIIGIVALATFFVPIGLYQIAEKRKIQKARNALQLAADNHGIQLNSMEIFRNGIGIGLDPETRTIVHSKNGQSSVLNAKDVESCRFYKTQRSEKAEDGSESVIQDMGLHLKLRNGEKKDVKLTLFEGREGTTYGDDQLITQRWVEKINALNKHKTQAIVVH